ncbi:hypothetical protein H6G00_01535 [Leptolyngbya sp. FACHB-541]|nr:hypothetical protein [Leptolyngbya sp. FACHB-541]
MNEVLDGTNEAVNGALVALTRPDHDESASHFLREVDATAANKIIWTRIQNTPVTSVSQAALFWSPEKKSVYNSFARAVVEHEDLFKRLGMILITNEKQAKDFIYECYAGAGQAYAQFQKRRKVAALSRRCVLFLGLMIQSKRSKTAADKLKLSYPLNANSIFKQAGLLPPDTPDSMRGHNLKRKKTISETIAVEVGDRSDIQLDQFGISMPSEMLDFDVQIQSRQDYINALQQKVDEMQQQISQMQIIIQQNSNEVAALKTVKELLEQQNSEFNLGLTHN